MEFPSEFRFFIRDPDVRAAFVSENISPQKTDCPNCGSVGYIYIFIATGGPFKDPSPNKVNHWTKNGWYVGETKSAVCPVCKAQEYHETFEDGKISPEVAKANKILMERWDLKGEQG
jgi:hypothetical protein